MVTNLPAEARAKWIKVMEARTIEEKIEALEEFLSAVPKHKGTENLRAWATRRLAELREELEERRKRGAGRGPSFFLEKEGAGQVAVVGPPNSGKSLLVNRLTGARTAVSEFPFSTTVPVPGMLKHEDVYFQLVDTPPLARESSYFSRVVGLIRNSDAVLIVLDNTSDVVGDYLDVVDMLESSGVLLRKPRGRVVIERSRSGRTGIRVTLMGKLVDATVDDVRRLLESYHIYNALVKVYGEVSLDDVEASIFENRIYKPSLVAINKADLDAERARRNFEELSKLADSPVLVCSAKLGSGLESLGKLLFETLGIIRVYTKQPNGEVSRKPLILPRGSTVYSVAQAIHSDFVERFQYARVWGPSAKYPGERVGLHHAVSDGDVVEIHIRG